MGTILLFIILGAIFYYIFKSYTKYTNEYSKEALKNLTITKESIQRSDLGLFVALVAKLAKADGRVDKLEAELIGIMFDDISAIFPEPHKTKEILKEIFNEEKGKSENTIQIAHTLGRAIKRDPKKQHHFMGFLIQLAFIDGSVSKSEEQLLTTIAEAFEIDPKIFHTIYDQFEALIKNQEPKATLEEAYKLLGVSQDATMESIKKQYRTLIKQYHPDIIKTQGKDDSYLKEATAKTQEINQAYEMIKESRKSDGEI